jgi:hypothetical protein
MVVNMPAISLIKRVVEELGDDSNRERSPSTLLKGMIKVRIIAREIPLQRATASVR